MSPIEKDFRAVFSSDAGKRALAHIVAASGFMTTDMILDQQGRADPLQTARNQGMRDMAGQILALCGAHVSLEPKGKAK